MWNRMLAEAVVIAVQTVILIGLCATIGVSGSDHEAAAESGWPLGLDLYRPEPADNPLTARKIHLGRDLGFEELAAEAFGAELAKRSRGATYAITVTGRIADRSQRDRVLRRAGRDGGNTRR